MNLKEICYDLLVTAHSFNIKSNSDSKVPNVKKTQNNSSAEIYILFYYITHYTFNNQIPVNIQ